MLWGPCHPGMAGRRGVAENAFGGHVTRGWGEGRGGGGAESAFGADITRG